MVEVSGNIDQFYIGKTNKKIFLINPDYEIIFERTARITETIDEDGDACENLSSPDLHPTFNRLLL